MKVIWPIPSWTVNIMFFIPELRLKLSNKNANEYEIVIPSLNFILTEICAINGDFRKEQVFRYKRLRQFIITIAKFHS